MQEQSIFTAALEKEDPTERKAFLDQVCAAAPALRQRIERLLHRHQQEDSFLETPVVAAVGGDTQGEQPRSEEDAEFMGFLEPSSRPGSIGRLAHYDVLEIIGRGGMGVVLRAFDDTLQRVVAIKVMAPQLATNATSRKRFIREAQAAAAVRNEHVIAIHAVDEAKGLPYLVMEYIAGQSLQERLDRGGGLELKEILRIGMQSARGLAAAHAEGLIHRDIKPANILLENGVERVKITDFGLARAVDDVHLTNTGMVAGTPQYMAPEQANGQAVDQRADLFSLGSVLYATCTGRPPFHGNTTMAVLKRICENTPRPIREINPDVPPWLVATIAKLLAKDPAERCQSAEEVAALLGHGLAELQQPAAMRNANSPKPAPPSLIAAVRMPHSAFGKTAAVLLLLIGGLGLTEATGVTRFVPAVIRIVTGEGTLVVEVDNPEAQVPIEGGRGAEAVAEKREAGRLQEEKARAHYTLGNALFEQGKLAEAVAAFREAIRLLPDFAFAHNNLGNVLDKQGKLAEAMAEYREALRIQPDYAFAHNNLGNTLRKQGNLDEGIAECREAIRLLPDYAAAHNNLGAALAKQDKLAEAVAAFREAIRLLPDYAMAHYNLGNVLKKQKKLEEAIAAYKEAIALDAEYAEAHCNLGLALRDKGQFADALAFVKKGHELGSKQPAWSYASARWLADCERLVELDSRLPAVLKGETRPKDPAEQFEFARLCALKQLPLAAARLYQEALTAKPEQTGFRVSAARAAALAGCGKGGDAAQLDETERARWRQQALDWLRADLEMKRQQLEGTPQARKAVQQALESWQGDPDFTGLRDAAPLAQLPAAERRGWQQVWADIEALLPQARMDQPGPRPFVVLGSKGIEEQMFETLAAAVAVARDGDTIEIRDNGPFITRPIDVGNRALTIRAAAGFAPVLRLSPEGVQASKPLLKTNSRLVLEGLELQRVAMGNNNLNQLKALVISGAGPLQASNCRFVLEGEQDTVAIEVGRSSGLVMRNCQLTGNAARAILFPAAEGQLHIENCLIEGGMGLAFNSVEVGQLLERQVVLHLTHNTLRCISPIGVKLTHDRPAPAQADRPRTSIQVEASANIFDGIDVFLFEPIRKDSQLIPLQHDQERARLRQLVSWRDQRNLYFARSSLLKIQNGKDRSLLIRLADWNQLWGDDGGDYLDGVVRFQGIVNAVREAARSAEAFRLHPDSPGYRAGPDGKDLGADVDLVGPGAAYERWKKTPAYQQWLKDTGQLMK